MPTKLKHCPFCGERPEPHQHHRHDRWALVHHCEVFGNLTIDWTALPLLLKRWNTRTEIIRKS